MSVFWACIPPKVLKGARLKLKLDRISQSQTNILPERSHDVSSKGIGIPLGTVAVSTRQVTVTVRAASCELRIIAMIVLCDTAARVIPGI